MILGVISLTALLLGVVAIILSSIAVSLVIGIKNSTHSFQMVDPLTQSFSSFTDETKKQMIKDDDTLNSIQ